MRTGLVIVIDTEGKRNFSREKTMRNTSKKWRLCASIYLLVIFVIFYCIVRQIDEQPQIELLLIIVTRLFTRRNTIFHWVKSFSTINAKIWKTYLFRGTENRSIQSYKTFEGYNYIEQKSNYVIFSWLHGTFFMYIDHFWNILLLFHTSQRQDCRSSNPLWARCSKYATFRNLVTWIFQV